MIFYDFRGSLSENVCKRLSHTMLLLVRQLFLWFSEFKRGQMSLKTRTDADSIQLRSQKEPSYTKKFQDVEGALEISSPSASVILCSHFCVKISSRWVPLNLTEAQKHIRVDWYRKCSKIRRQELSAGLQHCNWGRNLDLSIGPGS